MLKALSSLDSFGNLDNEQPNHYRLLGTKTSQSIKAALLSNQKFVVTNVNNPVILLSKTTPPRLLCWKIRNGVVHGHTLEARKAQEFTALQARILSGK